MPKIFILLLTISFLASCKQETPSTPTTSNDKETVEMKNRIAQLELDNSLKDSIINESLAFFNEIQSNLEAIGVKKDEIRVLSNDPELSNDDRGWILDQIRHINYLREDNARKVKQLNAELKSNGLKIQELEVMIESLIREIESKDIQITALQEELDQLDAEYSKLFNAYQEQRIEIDLMTEDMNTVYYAYGTEKELKENGVIQKKNGFIGIGKKISLNNEMNSDYFTSIDATKNDRIEIIGTDLHFISAHPTDSYEVLEEGGKTTIKILDTSKFWKISKYLVVIVD